MSGSEVEKTVNYGDPAAQEAVEAAVDAVLANHQGDLRAAIGGLLTAVLTLQSENRMLKGKVSSGYARRPPAAQE